MGPDAGVSGNSREYRPPIPVPKVGNGIFHSHSRSQKWEWNFRNRSRSRSRKLRMEIVIPVPATGNGISKSGIETGSIVGKKRDLGILDPMIFSGKIRKNTKS